MTRYQEKAIWSITALFYLSLALSCGFSEKKKNGGQVSLLDSLNQVILNDPDENSHYIARAHHYTSLGRMGDAYYDIERAISIDSLDSHSHYELGHLYFKNGRVGEAKFALERALELDPDNTDALLEMGEMLFVLTNHNLSMKYINRALRVNEQLSKAYFLKGLIYREQDNQTLAVSSLQTVTELDPDNIEAFNLLGMTYAEKGDSLALSYYDAALSIDSTDMEVLYNKGVYLQSQMRAQEAMASYEQLLRHHPDNSAAYFNIGYVLLGLMSDPDAALEAFDKSIALNPQNPQAITNKGVCFEEKGMLAEAREQFEIALELSPNYESAIQGMNRVVR